MRVTTVRALAVAISALVVVSCAGGSGTEDLTGAELFVEVGCQACHGEVDSEIAPTLHGIWGSDVELQDGRTVTVDEAYVQRSIADPGADVVSGFDARMPTFSLTDTEVERLVDYVRSLG